jgi:predicted PurR-regulated permease PerM
MTDKQHESEHEEPQKRQDNGAVPPSSEQPPDQKPTPPKQPAAQAPDERKTSVSPTEKKPLAAARERGRTSRLSYEALNRRALIGLLFILTISLIPVVRIFVAPIVVAIAFAALFYPFYRSILHGLRNRRGLSALICCLCLLLGALVPAYVLVHLVAAQTIELYSSAEPKVRDILEKGSEGPLGNLQRHPAVRWLRLQEIDWQSLLQEAARAAGRVGSFVVNRTAIGTLAALGNIFVIFFTLYYLFRDGDRILGRLRFLSPLRSEYEDMLLRRFLLISRASLKGTVLIGIIQGTLGAIIFLLVGIETWLVWGFVMVILAIIPFTGAWLIMVPAGIVQIVIGNIWQGVVILALAVGLVSTIDNVLRPRLVGGEARMHDLLIFFSTLGGISAFGVMGFIVGPVMAALFVSALDMYGLEFMSQLSAAEEAPRVHKEEGRGSRS